MLPKIPWASTSRQLEMHRLIIRRSTYPIPMGRATGQLSSGISLLLLYASIEVLGNTSVAIL